MGTKKAALTAASLAEQKKENVKVESKFEGEYAYL